jgi:Asp-tRNA(Asn)/Glu-tRNA(Gln) amidotransferase C subunit
MENQIDSASVRTLARALDVELPEEDVAQLVEAMRRYAEVVAALDAAELDDVEPYASLDPRVGW